MHHHHRNSFYWDTNIGEFMFAGFNVDGVQALLILSLVMILLTIIFEGFKVLQTKANARTAREIVQMPSASSSTRDLASTSQNQNVRRRQIKLSALFGQAVMFLFHNTLGYILMLSVMVYNGYLFVVVVLGLGLGYFLFGHISMKVNMENIRARTTANICSKSCETDPPLQGTFNSSGNGTGYVNEMVASSASSSTISDHCNNSNYTQTSLLDRDDVEYHQNNNYQQESQEHSKIIPSCHS